MSPEQNDSIGHMEKPPFVSVVIPVYDAGPLEECLKCLKSQAYPQEYFEIIVIDNGSPDDVAGIVGKYPGVKRVIESRPGSYRARNTGVDLARGEVLAFTDADCRPRQGWLKAGVQRLEQSAPNVVVGGRVTLCWDSDTPNLYELYDSIGAFDQETFVVRKNFSVTANLFVRKKTFLGVGFFDAALKSGGDWEWGRRAGRAGCDFSYCAEAELDHPARNSFAQHCHKQRRLVGGRWMNRKNSKPLVLLWAPLKEAVDTAYFIAVILRQRRARPRFAALVVLNGLLSLVRLAENLRLGCGGKAIR